jgi:hypothetical protein
MGSEEYKLKLTNTGRTGACTYPDMNIVALFETSKLVVIISVILRKFMVIFGVFLSLLRFRSFRLL